MAAHARKRSGSVRLALMGAAASVLATPGCGHDVQRNQYASMEDCVADYSAAQCHADYPIDRSYTGGSGLRVYGPWYRPNYSDPSDPGPGRLGRRVGFSSGTSSGGHGPTGVEAGHRGGFGSHGVSARG